MKPIALVKKYTNSTRTFFLDIKNTRPYIILFYTVIFLVYIVYYGARYQVDFTAFHRAASLFVSGENPYDRDYSFYFLNAPSALLFLFPIGFLEEKLASIFFRIFTFLLGAFLVWKIKESTKLHYLTILSIFALSTPVRTTFGSGLGGIIVAVSIWFLVANIIYQSENLSGISLGFIALGVLSFKPYLFLGILILYLSLKRIRELLWIVTIFVMCNLLISIRIPLLWNWLENMLVRSEGLTSEEGASSVVSIVNRAGELTFTFSGIGILAWFIYLILNSAIIFLIFTSQNLIIRVGFALVFSITSALYLNHRDFVLLPILILILLDKDKLIKFEKTMLYMSRCGLLVGSFLFQIVCSILEPKQKVKIPLLVICSLPSLISALFWSVDLRVSFLIYDISIQLVTGILIYNLYRHYSKDKAMAQKR